VAEQNSNVYCLLQKHGLKRTDYLLWDTSGQVCKFCMHIISNISLEAIETEIACCVTADIVSVVSSYLLWTLSVMH